MIVRSFVLIAGLVLAGLSGRDSALAYWRGHALEDVPSLFANDPQIQVTRAEADLMDPKAKHQDPARLEAIAKRALIDDPLNAAAVFELGAARELRNRGDGYSAFVLAETISRRDIPTQFALADANNLDGKLAAAVANYDRFFSVAPQLSEKIMPALAPNLDGAEVLTAFNKYAYRNWYPALISAAITAGVQSRAVSSMLASAQSSNATADLTSLRASMLSHALAARDFGALHDFVDGLPAKERAALSEFGVSAVSSDVRLAPLSWTLANDNARTASLTADGGLALAIGPEQTGILAERITLLKPGRYALQQTVSYDPVSPQAAIIWDGACEPAGSAPFWHQAVPRHPSKVTYRSTVVVPDGCLAQHWRLQATGDVGQDNSTAQILDLRLIAQ